MPAACPAPDGFLTVGTAGCGEVLSYLCQGHALGMLLDNLLLDLKGHRLMAAHERGKQPLGLAADWALETINRD